MRQSEPWKHCTILDQLIPNNYETRNVLDTEMHRLTTYLPVYFIREYMSYKNMIIFTQCGQGGKISGGIHRWPGFCRS